MPELITYTEGDLHLQVAPELGARVHRLRAFGVDLLRTPQDLDAHRRDPFFWGCYVMAPWCNRLDCRPVNIAGRTVALSPNFPDGSAIHGQVYAQPWQQVNDRRLEILAGGNTWPWRYKVAMDITAADAAITLDYMLTNVDDVPMPAGIGIHPWFAKPVEVLIPAHSVYPANAATAAKPEPVSPPFDLRSCAVMADDLDATWTGLTEQIVRLRWPQHEITASLAFAADQSCVVGASPAHLDAVAIEPQTHAPAGLRRLLHAQPQPMRLLDPGTSLSISYTFTARHNALPSSHPPAASLQAKTDPERPGSASW